MLDAAKYSVVELLGGGERIEIRALKPNDEGGLVAAVHRTSAQSLYRRFFGVRRDFSEKEVDFFVNVDFVNHVALVALIDEEGRSVIAGGGRYIVLQPGEAEVAFVVVDKYQGRGIGRALMKNLECRAASFGAERIFGDTLRANEQMIALARKSGYAFTASPGDWKLVRFEKTIDVVAPQDIPCASWKLAAISRQSATTPPLAG